MHRGISYEYLSNANGDSAYLKADLQLVYNEQVISTNKQHRQGTEPAQSHTCMHAHAMM